MYRIFSQSKTSLLNFTQAIFFVILWRCLVQNIPSKIYKLEYPCHFSKKFIFKKNYHRCVRCPNSLVHRYKLPIRFLQCLSYTLTSNRKSLILKRNPTFWIIKWTCFESLSVSFVSNFAFEYQILCRKGPEQ